MALTYERAQELFGKARNKDAGYKLANNTRLLKDGEDFVVRLHATDIIRIHPDGRYTLNSGGWRTHTTKDRLRAYSPAIIRAEKGLWYVYFNNGRSIFQDGMIVNEKGVPVNPVDPSRMEKVKSQVDKMVRDYIRGFVEHLKKVGHLEEPGPGDCWGCYFRAKDKPSDFEPMGYDHYLNHFEEKYYVPSLLYNALMERGYREPGFAWMLWEADLKRGRVSRDLVITLQAFFRKRKHELVKLLMDTEQVEEHVA